MDYGTWTDYDITDEDEHVYRLLEEFGYMNTNTTTEKLNDLEHRLFILEMSTDFFTPEELEEYGRLKREIRKIKQTLNPVTDLTKVMTIGQLNEMQYDAMNDRRLAQARGDSAKAEELTALIRDIDKERGRRVYGW